MWIEECLRELLDVAQAEHVSGPARIILIALISLVFLIGIASLFLLAFVIEGQSLLRRSAFLMMGLGILAYYLQFLYIVARRKKNGKR